MRLRSFSVVVFAAVAVLAAYALSPAAPKTRTFEFAYAAEIPVPKGAGTVSVWVPYPTSDEYQKVRDVRVKSAVETEIRKDAQGNSILHFTVADPKAESIPFEMTFVVERTERVNRAFSKAKAKGKPGDDLAPFLGPDKRVPLSERIRDLSAEVTAGKKTDLEKARAIYDYVVSTMKYDKSGEGWGHGDIYWACDAKRGNCTDFHALFIGLARAAGIPARFSIGFPIPEERGEGKVGGYHCWAEFWIAGTGWVPVDTSEAAKNPGKRDYFFGAHDENRVQLTTGRDLVLAPKQKGDPLNFFVYPYAEADGKPVKDVTKSFRFRDLS